MEDGEFPPMSEFCVICSSELSEDEGLNSNEDTNNDLLDLCKILKVSSTIYNGIDLVSLSALTSSLSSCSLYCLSCQILIRDSLQLLKDIEDKQTMLGVLVAKIKKYFVTSYRDRDPNNDSNASHSLYLSHQGQKQQPWVSCSGTDDPRILHSTRNLAKSHIRQTFAQCWSNCRVNVGETYSEKPLKKQKSRSANDVDSVTNFELPASVNETTEDNIVVEKTSRTRWSSRARKVNSRYFEPCNIKTEKVNVKSDPVDNIEGKASSDPLYFSDSGSIYASDNLETVMTYEAQSHSALADNSDADNDDDYSDENVESDDDSSSNFTKKPTRTRIRAKAGARTKPRSKTSIKARNRTRTRTRLKSKTAIKNENPKPTPSLNPVSRGAFLCSVCNQDFETAPVLFVHEIEKHSFPSQNTRNENGILVKFTCGYCSKEYVQSDYLTLGTNLTETGSSERPNDLNFHIECDQENCTRTFSDFRIFQLHHGNTCSMKPKQKPIPIPHPSIQMDLGSRLKRKSIASSRKAGSKNVKNTLKICPQRPGKTFKYNCKLCGKGYDLLFYFENHVKCHQGELNFECDLCLVKFVSGRSLKAHKIKMHDDNILIQPVALDNSIDTEGNGDRDEMGCTNITDSDVVFEVEIETDSSIAFAGKQTKRPKVTCSVCNEDFHSTSILHKHQIKMHSFPSESSFDDQGKLIKFQCGYCSTEYLKSDYVGDDSLPNNIHIDCDQQDCDKSFQDFPTFRLHHGHTCKSKPVTEQVTEPDPTVAEREIISHRQDLDSGPDSKRTKLSSSLNVRNTLKIKRHEEFAVKRKYNCEVCGKGYDLLYYFEDHMKCHQGELNFQCDICLTKFVSDRSVRAHKLRVHNIPDDCGRKAKRRFGSKSKSSSRATLKKIRNSNKGEAFEFECDVCLEKFASERSLSTHKTITHYYTDGQECEYEGQGQACRRTYDESKLLMSFVCPFCQKEYRKSDYLANKDSMIHCDVFLCDRKFPISRFSHFCHHHKATCLAKPREIFKCDLCPTTKCFSSKVCLENHMVSIHTKKFPFYCEECGRGQVTAGALADHQRRVHGGRKFKCNICDRNYKVKKHLENHMRRHNNDLRYVCGHCGKKFLTSRHLVTHELVRHIATGNNYPCSICNKAFRTKNYLRHHVWAVHEKLRRKPGKVMDGNREDEREPQFTSRQIPIASHVQGPGNFQEYELININYEPREERVPVRREISIDECQVIVEASAFMSRF